MIKKIGVLLGLLMLLTLSACGIKSSVKNSVTSVKNMVGLSEDRTVYRGTAYLATDKTAIAFHPAQTASSCRVFAEALVQLPANLSGKEVETAILAEAKKRGADQVLIGQARQSTDSSGPKFFYYGPSNEYFCADQCGSWKFGYDLWEEQGEWVTLGYKEWGNARVSFETPLLVRLILLRCR